MGEEVIVNKSLFAADCSLPNDKGPCDQDLTRHYYDSSDNKCKQFTYGGCDGNSNNFLSADICYAECGKEGNEGKYTVYDKNITK